MAEAGNRQTAETIGETAIWPGYRDAVVVDACSAPGQQADGSDRVMLDAAGLEAIRESGVTAINFTVGAVGSYRNDYRETINNIVHWDARIAAHPDALMKVTAGSQVDQAKRSGRLGIIYGFQDTTMYGEDLARFDEFHAAGVRIIQLTYNRRNLVGDGCMEPGDAGLSLFGRELLSLMNARGVLVDLSHCGRQTTREATELSTAPVAVTHSGCAALAANPRNKSDQAMRAVAKRGGVFGVYAMPYLRDSGQVLAEDVIRHIEHALEVCGEDHVGLGTDGIIAAVELTPAYQQAFAREIAKRQRRGIAAPGERADCYTFALDLNTPHRYQQLAFELSQRGHSDARIEKVLGANFARLFREVIV